MKLALLLFVFVLIGSINSIQGGRRYYATPSPETGCWGGYEMITTYCNPKLLDGEGDNGVYKGASGSECFTRCRGAESYCSQSERCCCRKSFS